MIISFLTAAVAAEIGTKTETDYVDARPSGYYSVEILGSSVYGKYPNGTVIASGTAGTDDGEVIMGVVTNATAGSTISFNGAFATDGPINITKSLNLYGYGSTASFLWNENGQHPLFKCYGANGATTNLTANTAPGATSIAVDDVSGISSSKIIIIYDNTIWNPWYTTYPSWKAGEIHTVTSVNGNTVNLGEPVITGYTTAQSAKCKIITPITTNFNGLYIYSTGNSTDQQYGISIQYGKDATLSNMRIDKMGLESISTLDSINMTVTGNTISNSENSGEGYGVVVGDASAFVTVQYNNITTCRHCIATGGTGSIGQPRNITYASNNLIGYTLGSGYPVDAHPEVVSLEITNNTISVPYAGGTDGGYGMGLGARYAYIHNNTVINGVKGWGMKGRPPIQNQTWIVQNNTFVNSTYGFYVAANATPSNAYGWDYIYFHDNIIKGNGTLLYINNPPSVLEMNSDMLIPSILITNITGYYVPVQVKIPLVSDILPPKKYC